MKAQWGIRGTAPLFHLTLALDGVNGYRHAAVALYPEMTRHALYRRLGGGGVGDVFSGAKRMHATHRACRPGYTSR